MDLPGAFFFFEDKVPKICQLLRGKAVGPWVNVDAESWDAEPYEHPPMREEGYDPGNDDYTYLPAGGYDDGCAYGLLAGWKAGRERGYEDGLLRGLQKGKAKGKGFAHSVGMDEGFSTGFSTRGTARARAAARATARASGRVKPSARIGNLCTRIARVTSSHASVQHQTADALT